MKLGVRIWLGFVLLPAAMPVAGQQGSAPKRNPLLNAKLIYVEPMPSSLDQWVSEDLRVWGKYKRTNNPEGVDLVVQADVPERPTGYDTRGGAPRPREKRSKRASGSERCPNLKPSDPPPITIDVVDWVTSDRLWYAHLIDKKLKRDEPERPAGPHADIYTRGLTPDQVAMKITTKLREYVGELEKAEGSKL